MPYACGMRFLAHVISGSGVARQQNVPTLNLALNDVPESLEQGIYACRVRFEQESPSKPDARWAGAVMHHGPRFVHRLPVSCEVHLIERMPPETPAVLNVEIVQRLRNVQDFNTPQELQDAIEADIAAARAILGA